MRLDPGLSAALLAATLLIPAGAHAGARQEGRAVMPAEPQERQFQQDWGYSSAIVSGDTVYLCGVTPDPVGDVATQTAQVLRRVDRLLAKAGTDRSRLLSAQVWLREHGRGFVLGPVVVPIVPGAILFDLTNGGDKDWGRFPPYRDLGYAATANAGRTFALGTAGAGWARTCV